MHIIIRFSGIAHLVEFAFRCEIFAHVHLRASTRRFGVSELYYQIVVLLKAFKLCSNTHLMFKALLNHLNHWEYLESIGNNKATFLGFVKIMVSLSMKVTIAVRIMLITK